MGKSESGKTEVVYCRVNKTLKERLEKEASENENGEAEAVIVRRALHEYFDRRDHPEKYPETRPSHSQINEALRKQHLPPAAPDPRLVQPHERGALKSAVSDVENATNSGKSSPPAQHEAQRMRKRRAGDRPLKT